MELLGYIAAVFPFVVAGVALLWLRWSAARAGVSALAVALAVGLLWPAFDAGSVPGALLSGIGTAANVLYILAGGLLLYNVLSQAGAVGEVSGFLSGLEPDKTGLALLVVLGVAPFFESVTGFGVAVVISAPILLSAGFSPLKAAALSSWGQLAVPWGALGVGTIIGAELADVTFHELSTASALLSLPLFPLYGLAAVALAGGRSGLYRRGLEATLLGLVGGMGVLLCSLYLVPELSGAVGGLVVVGVFLFPRVSALRRTCQQRGAPLRALSPYGFLLCILVITSGFPLVEEALLRALGPILSGPGTALVAAAAFAAVVFRLRRDSVKPAFRGTLGQWLPVAGAILTFVLAGQAIASSGAAALLAGGAAGVLGPAYPAVAPIVGALGGALTGSNAGSNALFMPFQAETAATSGNSVLSLAALQNVAGSQANLLAPQRIVLAASATGLMGKEAEIARAIVPPVALSLLVLGIVGAFLAFV